MRQLPMIVLAFLVLLTASCGRSQKPYGTVAASQQPMAGAIVNGKAPDAKNEKPSAKVPGAEADEGFPKFPEDEAAKPRDPQAQAELDKLQGTWILTHYDNGNPETPRMPGKLIVTGDKYVFEFANSITRGRLRLDPSHSPAHIDAVITDPQTGLPSVLPGLYEWDGDKHRSIFAQAGRPRPTNFMVTPNRGLQLFVFVREKKPDSPAEPKSGETKPGSPPVIP
ncbi:MAG: TIGR03067 domain-containing protein [Gemmatales bacterium]|nr:TIGR03067 domain-containing protein [Gemmatales bacterium]MDW8385919.1 TIGR03067 domain-containing protein [Gemmatales bacterium]